MTKERLIKSLELYKEGKLYLEGILADVDAYSAASNGAKPTVGGALPPDDIVEWWWAGDNSTSDKFWHDAPYRTNGDVIEDIKAALKHFMGGNDR